MRRVRSSRGLSESVQTAVLLPFVLMTILGIIQGGLWLHGRTVASDAAVAAAEHAALLDASVADARALGARVASRGGLVDVQIVLSRSEASVAATVTGRVPGLVEGPPTRVTGQSHRPRERVTGP